MSSDRSGTILRLAELVTDGAVVNWPSEKAKAPDSSGELAELEMVDRIRMAHSAPDEKAPNGTQGSTAPLVPRPLFRWGKLEVLEWLGEGSFGEVYRAYDPALQTELALKLLKDVKPPGDPSAERFLSEARRLARVRHPNVVVVHGVETHDGRPGLWTEFLRGKTLETCLEGEGPWDARQAALAGIDLCRALAAVHAAGLIHRDVKTTNVMREKGGRIVLMDFGSGGELPRPGSMLTSQHIHGTPMAMAPEQLRGQVAGPATDIYGLGVLLYRLVTRAFPVEAETIGELAERHSRGERKSLRDRRPDLSTDFVQVVERALELEPADRYPTAGAMESALARTLHTHVHGLKWRRVAPVLLAAGLVLAIGWSVGRMVFRSPAVPDKTFPPPPGQGAIRPEATLTARASLFRHKEAGDERLLPGARVALGDRLFMSLQGSDSMFVYVLNEDDAGHIYVLFPIRGLYPANPLAPNVEYRLPERLGSDPAYWKITSAGGKERITAIASGAPLPGVEREIERFPSAKLGRPLEYPEISAGALRSSLRGIGGLETAPTVGSDGSPSRVSDMLKALSQRGRSGDEPWIWQQDLENPKPAP